MKAGSMFDNSKRLLRAGLFLLVAASAASLGPAVNEARATEIRYVVNGTPVTSYDIDRRAAFMRLRRESGNLGEKAAQEMIEQTLRLQEMKRVNVTVPDQMVEEAFQRFASNNNISTSQLNKVLSQAGVTSGHFKEFIRSQIGWNRVLQARGEAQSEMSEQDVVAKMLEQGGEKPTATEYTLQQVIFVVPSDERAQLLGKRKREARAMRDRFQDCDSTFGFAKGLRDVTVRDLGRVLAPELPPLWKDDIAGASPGQATGVRETERGVEFIGICSTRQVSDDRVAQMVFQSEENEGTAASSEAGEEYMAQLRERAQIVER